MSALPAGRSFLDALPAVEAKIEAENPPERGLMLTLKWSGEERAVFDNRSADELYALRPEEVWGLRRVRFADGSFVDPAEVAHARPLVKEDLAAPSGTAQATSDAVGAIADAASALADAADGISAAGGGGEPVTAGDAPAPWGPEDFANWTPEAVAMRWAELRATPTLESYDEFTALTAEKKRRGLEVHLDLTPHSPTAPAPSGAAT